MSEINCNACDTLKTTAPNVVQNGITDTECASLAVDTGLNPNLSPKHNDAEDLHNMNDCLIGRQAGDLEKFNICDWQNFMERFIPNLYETLKGIICAIGGVWTYIHNLLNRVGALEGRVTNIEGDVSNLWDFARDICEKSDQSIIGRLPTYGSLPLHEDTSTIFGTMGTKNGVQLVTFPTDQASAEALVGSSWTGVGVGIGFMQKDLSACATGDCMRYEWIVPWLFGTTISSQAAVGDILWYASKADVQAATGMSDYLWNVFTVSSWTWNEGDLGDRRNAYIELTIDANRMGPDYLTMVYQGTSYPNTGLANDTRINYTKFDIARVYTSGCV